MIRSIPYLTNNLSVELGLNRLGVSYEKVIDRVVTLDELKGDGDNSFYECTCCYSLSEGHQEHCGTWLNED